MTNGSLDALGQVLDQRQRANRLNAAAAVLTALDPVTGAPTETVFQIGNWPELVAWTCAPRPLAGQLTHADVYDVARPEEIARRATLITLLDDRPQPIA